MWGVKMRVRKASMELTGLEVRFEGAKEPAYRKPLVESNSKSGPVYTSIAANADQPQLPGGDEAK